MGLIGAVTSLFKGKDVLKDTLAVVDELHASGEEKGALRKDVISTWVEAQSGSLIAEYQYGNLLSRSWRPAMMLLFGGIVTWHYWLAPALGMPAGPEPPSDFWLLLHVGVTGYIGGRTLEKIAAMVAPGAKLKKLLKELDK